MRQRCILWTLPASLARTAHFCCSTCQTQDVLNVIVRTSVTNTDTNLFKRSLWFLSRAASRVLWPLDRLVFDVTMYGFYVGTILLVVKKSWTGSDFGPHRIILEQTWQHLASSTHLYQPTNLGHGCGHFVAFNSDEIWQPNATFHIIPLCRRLASRAPSVILQWLSAKGEKHLVFIKQFRK